MWKKRPLSGTEGEDIAPESAGLRMDTEDLGEVRIETVRDRTRHRIVFTAVLFIALFAAMTIYFCRYAIENRRTLFDNDYNSRDTLLEQHNRRGRILAHENGEERELAVSDENNIRTYPYGEQFAHVVGYSILGGSGIEEYMKYELLHSDIPFSSKLDCDREGSLYPGNDVYTTLDVSLQHYAWQALGDYRGAVLITEPSTGRILAMVSKPDFDPNLIYDRYGNYTYWESLRTNESGGSQLLNRATQGVYPPGSTFKIIDCIELLQEDPSAPDTFSYNCTDGVFEKDGENIHCFMDTRTGRYEIHGSQHLAQAFAHSCNSAFAKMVTEDIDEDSYRKTLKKLMFDEQLPYDLPCSMSHSQLLEDGDISTHNLMQVAIGQGTTEVSPLHMNMITMAIANGGVLMQPRLIDRVCTAEGELMKEYSDRQAAVLMKKDIADTMRDLMSYVTKVSYDESTGSEVYGTASEFDGTQSYQAFGKTGTAEFGDDEDSHAWFTGFTVPSGESEDGEAQLCITVLVENGGVGADKAVPIAKEILDRWYGEW